MRASSAVFLAVTFVGCGRSPLSERDNEPPPKVPAAVPIDAAPPVEVPAHAMLCHGKEDFVWFQDGHTAKLAPELTGIFTGLDGKLYTRDFDAVKAVGAGPSAAKIPLGAGGPGGDFNYTIVVRSPTEALAWHAVNSIEPEKVLEWSSGAWKPVPNVPPAKDKDDNLIGVTYGADGKLWLARNSGAFVRFEGDAFSPVTMKLGTMFAMAATPGGVYIGTNRELMRFDAQAATKLATFDGYVHSINVNSHGHVAAVVDGVLLLASDTDKKATRINLPQSVYTRNADVDAAGRAWVMVRGELLAFAPDGTKTAYPRGALADMPQRDRGCEPIGDGFETLPKPGASTGELRLAIRGGGGLQYEVCDDPKSGSRESACAGQPGIQAGTLDSSGNATLQVPTGYYVPAVRKDGEWLVPDYSNYSPNQTAGWCDVIAGTPCTIEVAVGD